MAVMNTFLLTAMEMIRSRPKVVSRYSANLHGKEGGHQRVKVDGRQKSRDRGERRTEGEARVEWKGDPQDGRCKTERGEGRVERGEERKAHAARP